MRLFSHPPSRQCLAPMIPLLRLVALLLGLALTFAPAALLLFAHGMERLPPANRLFDLLAPLIIIGLAFGLGPLLVAWPQLVVGTRKPLARLVAGLLLLISVGGLAVFGAGGTASLWLAVFGLSIEMALFAVFVWPARRFALREAPSAGQNNSPSR